MLGALLIVVIHALYDSLSSRLRVEPRWKVLQHGCAGEAEGYSPFNLLISSLTWIVIYMTGVDSHLHGVDPKTGSLY